MRSWICRAIAGSSVWKEKLCGMGLVTSLCLYACRNLLEHDRVCVKHLFDANTTFHACNHIAPGVLRNATGLEFSAQILQCRWPGIPSWRTKSIAGDRLPAFTLGIPSGIITPQLEPL